MKKDKLLWKCVVIVIMACVGIAVAVAQDNEARAGAMVEKGDQAWSKRDAVKNIYQTIEFYGQAAEIDRGRVDVLVKLALANYWLGEVLPEDKKKERIAAYEACYDASRKALELSETDPGANLWATVCNGRRTELVGLLSGTYDLGLAIICLGRVARYDYDYYYGAIYRYWGRFVYEIPELGRRLVHFTLDDSATLLKEGLKIEPNFFLTRLYLAETYLAADKRDPAKQELLYIVNTPADIVPKIAPENRFYQARAKELLKKEFPDLVIK
jgi:hypothetical protein